tara:strand:+ start:25 stop:1062 length:1038 start_codon:yes stop_codon:yes gene_type:complete
MIKSLIKYSERGLVPDLLIKFGIRKLCKSRLNWAKELGEEGLEEFHQTFITKLEISPIALVPKSANEQHYEVPPSFFKIVLGKHLKYSSGLWTSSTSNLDESEEKMLELTFKRADLKDGQDILELGCGWGSLTCYMAEKLPNSKITAVSNSKDQKAFILAKCKKHGLLNVNVITADMNDFNINYTFDRVVSVEMFEHMRNYKELMKKIYDFLKPSGKLFIHIFTHKEMVYPFEDNGEGDWMAREFFSGGIMPSHRLLLYFQDHLKIETTWKMSGMNYSRTSMSWLNNMDCNKGELINILADNYGVENAKVWFQRWRIFFMSCAELFGLYNGSEWGVSHYLFKKIK